jgi:nucleoside-diphosphate-sugar epimerase
MCAKAKTSISLALTPLFIFPSAANDACGDLDPKLTCEIGCLATMQLADRAAREGIGRFLYASSGSVYGISDAPQVTEEESGAGSNAAIFVGGRTS